MGQPLISIMNLVMPTSVIYVEHGGEHSYVDLACLKVLDVLAPWMGASYSMEHK